MSPYMPGHRIISGRTELYVAEIRPHLILLPLPPLVIAIKIVFTGRES